MSVRFIKLNNAIVEIDDNIADNVVLLNKKGYKTLSSCGGHPDRKVYLVNIIFDKDYGLSPPDKFRMNIKKKFTGLEFYVNSNKPKGEEKYNLALKDFSQWVAGLPYIK